MKQAIINAIDSWGFRSILVELRKKYLKVLENKKKQNPQSKFVN